MKVFLTLIFASLFMSNSFAQTIWKTVNLFDSTPILRRSEINLPTSYHVVSLDINSLKIQLANKHSKKIELVYPDGSFKTFDLKETVSMEADIAAKYPNIKTYQGVNIESGDVARFDINTFGFHGNISSRNGEIYIDPYGNDSTYLSYYTKNALDEVSSLFSCGTVGAKIDQKVRSRKTDVSRMETEDLHIFRLAMACTGEWGEVRGSKEQAMGDMVTLVNRLNQIFENELGTKLILINNNDQLIHLNSLTDPYPIGNNGSQILSTNNDVINTILLSSALYDLGHVLTARCVDVGGIAYLSALCGPLKAGGVTCDRDRNVSSRTVRIAAHEIGHQLGADHTFNNCGGNESFGNDFEPGSGSTIMSYAGLCGSSNVQSNGDLYYHQASLFQIYNLSRFVNSPAYGCSTKEPIDNHYPDVDIKTGDGFYIPTSTPFYLHGDASDADADKLTFSWEQKDSSLASAELGNPVNNSPSFRSYPPGPSMIRFLPNKADLLTNVSRITEVLPTYARGLHFSFTARDNNPDGGLAAWDLISFNVDGDAGPFKITNLNMSQGYEVGENLTVNWDVANTDNNKVNCQSVDIYLSLNGALHESDQGFIKIASAVPNSGTSNVILPNTISNQARIVVRATNNIFFDVSDQDFTIVEATKPVAYFAFDEVSNKLCLPNETRININTESFGNYDGNISFEIENDFTDLKSFFDNTTSTIGDSNRLNLNFSNNLQSGLYPVKILGISDLGDTISRIITFDLTSTDFSDLNLLAPENGLINALDQQNFTWSSATNASSYQLSIADNPIFENPYINEELTDTTYLNLLAFEKSKNYFWRVIATNECGTDNLFQTSAFSTPNQNCDTFEAIDLPINISQTGTPSIESFLTVPSSLIIEDINVKAVGISHENMKDLSVSLISPNNTKVLLWESQCPRSTNSIYSFDDQSPRFFSCATNVEGAFKPQQKLSLFNGEDAKGIWKLVLDDNNNENGGALNGFAIEFCGNVIVQSPYFINNELIKVKHLSGINIVSLFLSVGDDDSSNENLIYTIVKNTNKGDLLLNGVVLQNGDSFFQSDINFSNLKYKNNLPTELEEGESAFDYFEVIVNDDNAGWVGIERVNIEVNADFTSSINNTPKLQNKLIVFPNPAYSQITIKDQSQGNMKIKIFDFTGKLHQQQNITANEKIDISGLNQGIYIIKGESLHSTYSAKFTVTR